MSAGRGSSWAGAEIPNAALLVIDVQNGFISEAGELPVPGGAEVIPAINELLPHFPVRVATQDWHPRDHGSFASRHPGATRPFAPVSSS